MGRAFEFRKERKFKRWGNMARVFTKLGKEITIATKSGGPDPDNNPRLRSIIQTARSENMPKDNIDRAIKRAVEKDQGDFKEIVYEGFGPHGIAFLIETATDNNMRTVANIRSYFTKHGGVLSTQGSVDFMFERKCVFKIEDRDDINIEDLELNLIDLGVDEVFRIAKDEEDEDSKALICIYGAFESFGIIQKYLEENGYEMVTAGFERIPTVELKKLSPDDQASIEALIEKIESDDDVQNVYTTMDY